MKLSSTSVKDLFMLHRSVRTDERGSFSRLFAVDELAAIGYPINPVHVNTSTSTRVGTLRGIHFQYPQYTETKIVACTTGAVWDVGVDLRPNSSTRFQWFGTLLTPENGISMIIPEGFGHAFITIEPNSTVVYVTSAIYNSRVESGLRFDDPDLAIQWPVTPTVISKKDRVWGLLEHRISELDKGFEKL